MWIVFWVFVIIALAAYAEAAIEREGEACERKIRERWEADRAKNQAAWAALFEDE